MEYSKEEWEQKRIGDIIGKGDIIKFAETERFIKYKIITYYKAVIEVWIGKADKKFFCYNCKHIPFCTSRDCVYLKAIKKIGGIDYGNI